MHLVIYGHGGSCNHGNEAIVRGVRELFPMADLDIYSFEKEVDERFQLSQICKINSMVVKYPRISIRRVILHFLHKYFPTSNMRYKIWFSPFLKKIDKNAIYILEAGDQYCEKGEHRYIYAFLNKYIRNKGAKTVMLGCTINPEYIDDVRVQCDLKNYSLVIARESITYEALKKVGIFENVYLAPDPAFAMRAKECKLPSIFKENKVVGINVGFLAQGNEEYYEKLIRNYECAIKYLLEETVYSVALIPHVYWSEKYSDLYTLKHLYERFKNYRERIAIIPENNAANQKFIISKCDFFIALRTHATIPAIESKVPTLITGYKVKSTGICRDIFDGDMNLFIDIQNLTSDKVILERLKWLITNEKKVKKLMNEAVPRYVEKLKLINKYMDQLNESEN